MYKILAILLALFLCLGSAETESAAPEAAPGTLPDGVSTAAYPAEPGEGESAPQAYVLRVTDQEGAPVPGVYVNFCTDAACTMKQSDENGDVVFGGEPGEYHVQLLKVPEGYSFDPEFELYTGPGYGGWTIVIRKDEE